jgi:hypothetical protein
MRNTKNCDIDFFVFHLHFNSLVDLPARLVCLPCLPALPCLTALSACLLCFVPATNACSSKWIFAAATNITNKTKHGRQFDPLISLLCIVMSMY